MSDDSQSSREEFRKFANKLESFNVVRMNDGATLIDTREYVDIIRNILVSYYKMTPEVKKEFGDITEIVDEIRHNIAQTQSVDTKKALEALLTLQSQWEDDPYYFELYKERCEHKD